MPRIAARAVVFSLLVSGSGEASRESGRVWLQGYAGQALRRAVAGAGVRLARPACARVLMDFHDASGMRLDERVASLGLDAPSYLERVIFVDGIGYALCRREAILAVTVPGSRIVGVCGNRFLLAAARNPAYAEAIVIHETLHSLGLGEDPPTSAEITARVVERCGS
jgi:hypothetical protein